MRRGVRVYVIGSLVLTALAALAGCGRNYFIGEREAWRREAEVECLKSGAVKESPTQVRIDPIRGPGMCGADFPLKVEALGGDRPVYGFADELRPPAGIPNVPSQPRWPITEPRYSSPSYPPSQYPQSQYPQPQYSQPQYAAPQAAPQIQARPLPPADTQYLPRGAPRVGVPEAGAPMSITPPGAEPPRTATGRAERPLGAPQTAYPSYPQTAYPQSNAAQAAPRPGAPQWIPAPQAVEDDEDDIPDDTIRPSAPQPAKRNPPRATPVPLGTRPSMVTGSVGPVEVKPAATLACPIVSALDQWIAGAVQPAAIKWLGQPVVEIKQISAYSCRGMNGQPGARISEHAFGNALDIAAFVLADGRKVTVKDGWYGLPEEQGFLRDVEGAACAQFTTVLAPGSNRFHYDHIHVDLMRRASGRVACNPRAIPGEVAAQRAKQRGSNWARKGGDNSITGSIGARKKDKPFRLFGPLTDEDEFEEDEGAAEE